MITKVTDAALASLCAPAAVAWIAPAPREANAAAASTAGRATFSVVDDDLGAGCLRTVVPRPETIRSAYRV